MARWGFVSLTMATMLLLLWLHQAGSMSLGGLRDAVAFLVLGEVCLVTLVAINLSATAVSKEREDGSLDTMLTTPIQPGPYLSGKHRGLVRFLLPMMAVPLASLVLVMLYTFFQGFGTPVSSSISLASGQSLEVSLIQWQAVACFVIMFVPYMAFCVMIGLMWSIRSQGTIGSVVAGVLIVGILVTILSLCMSPIMGSSPIFGPLVASLSPANLILSGLDPTRWLSNSMQDPGRAFILMLVGGVISAGAYSLGAVLLHRQMSRTFMMTVRQLAGRK